MITVMLLSAMLSAGSVTVPAGPSPKETAFTAEERKQALEALQTIARTFDEKQAPQGQAQQPQEKTMADVADKALEISTKYIGQAAAIIEKAAPRVWEVMVKQQYAKAIGQLITPLIWICILIAVAVSIRSFWRLKTSPDVVVTNGDKTTTRPHDCKRDRCTTCSDDEERIARNVVTLIIPAIGCTIAGGVLADSIPDSVMYLINPEYYAIKDLVQILLHGGGM